MQAWQRFYVSTDEAIGEPGDLPALFGGNNTGLSEADLLHAGDLLPMDHPERDDYINQGFRLVEVDDPVAETRSLTRLQYTSALDHFGGLSAVFDAVELLDPTDDVRLYFDQTANFNRDDARYLAMETALGADEEDTDAVFAYGATLDP